MAYQDRTIELLEVNNDLLREILIALKK